MKIAPSGAGRLWTPSEDAFQDLQVFCGKICRDPVWYRIGAPVKGVYSGGPIEAEWRGFARTESLKSWLRKGVIGIDIPCDKFEERDHDRKSHIFMVPEGKVIAGLFSIKEDEIRVITREARSDIEASIHSRWPLLIEERWAA